MIKLSHLQPFAKGTTRHAYVHPDHADQCLKILPAAAKAGKDHNNNEWKGYCAAAKMRDEAVWEHIPRCYGFVETDLGKALCVQLIRNADDLSFAASLDKRIEQGGADDSLKRSFEVFKTFALRTGFYTNCLGNIISARLADGKERLYFAECKYRRPGLTFIPAVLQKRTQKKIARLQMEFCKRVDLYESAAKQ